MTYSAMRGVESFWTKPDGPWWGVPVIAGVFLLLVGGLTFLANFYLKRLELNRGDRSKWDEDILKQSILIDSLCADARAVGNPSDQKYEKDITKRIPVYAAVSRDMGPPVNRLSFIASENLGERAVALMLAAMNEGLIHDYSHLPPKERKAKEKSAARIPTLTAASKDFKTAVRKELRAKK